MFTAVLLLVAQAVGRPAALPVATTAELRARLVESVSAGGDLDISLQEGAIFALNGTELHVESARNIVLLCEGRAATIDAAGFSRALHLGGNGSLTLKNVHIVNGVADVGGCVLVDSDTAQLSLFEVGIANCTAAEGGGIAVVNGTIETENTRIVGCTANSEVAMMGSAVGGGMLIGESASAELRRTSIVNCSATLSSNIPSNSAGGGGIFVASAKVVSLIDCELSHCSASSPDASGDGGGKPARNSVQRYPCHPPVPLDAKPPAPMIDSFAPTPMPTTLPLQVSS